MKKPLLVILALVMTLTLVIGSVSTVSAAARPATIHVTRVSLNKHRTTLQVGATETLIATITPANATSKMVTWTTSNRKIASVSSSGEVTGVAFGTAAIMVKTADGQFIDTCSVTVTAKPRTIHVTGVSLNKHRTTLQVGVTETLIATVTPANATNKVVTWTTSNKKTATVSQSGGVTGVAVGTAAITVKTADGQFIDACFVTVTAKPGTIHVTGVSLNKHRTTLQVGATETLAATITPANATNKAVTWATSNGKIATISQSGDVTGMAVGTAGIMVKTADGNYIDTCAVSVTAKSATVHVTGVSLNKNRTTIQVGATETLIATVTPANATNVQVTWITSNSKIATVSQSGEVTGVAVGTAAIMVKTADGQFIDTCTVSVTAKPETIHVTGVSLNKHSINIQAGATETLIATITPANATNKAVTWATSNGKTATVSQSGGVTGVAAGTAAIMVKTADGQFMDTCTVTVGIPLTGIGPIGGIYELGQPITVAGTLSPAGATATYQWKSSNTAGGPYSDISGATSETYTLVAADQGKYILVEATGTGDYTGEIRSDAVLVGIPLTGIGPISGIHKSGQTLTVAGTLSPAGASAAYQWKSSDTAGGPYSDIPGATSESYTLVAADQGKYILVEAIGTVEYVGSVGSDPIEVWTAGLLFYDSFFGYPNNYPPAGWAVSYADPQPSGNIFMVKDSTDLAGGVAPELWANWYSGDVLADCRISTPEIDATSAAKGLCLSFRHLHQIAQTYDPSNEPYSIAVEVSTFDAGNWSSWSPTSFVISPVTRNLGPTIEMIDLAAYRGMIIKISWRMYGYTLYSGGWSIDNVEVTGN